MNPFESGMAIGKILLIVVLIGAGLYFGLKNKKR